MCSRSSCWLQAVFVVSFRRSPAALDRRRALRRARAKGRREAKEIWRGDDPVWSAVMRALNRRGMDGMDTALLEALAALRRERDLLAERAPGGVFRGVQLLRVFRAVEAWS